MRYLIGMLHAARAPELPFKSCEWSRERDGMPVTPDRSSPARAQPPASGGSGNDQFRGMAVSPWMSFGIRTPASTVTGWTVCTVPRLMICEMGYKAETALPPHPPPNVACYISSSASALATGKKKRKPENQFASQTFYDSDRTPAC